MASALDCTRSGPTPLNEIGSDNRNCRSQVYLLSMTLGAAGNSNDTLSQLVPPE